MVPVAIERRLRAKAEGADTAFSVFRMAAERLPARDDSLLDRLFALECLLRSGRTARAMLPQLLPARSDAAWYIEQNWEPDIPHLAVLGQAISTIDASGDDPPASWVPKFSETFTEIAARRTRLGLASSPELLAAVLRGLGVIGLVPPETLLDGVRAYLTASRDPVITAGLADALARGRPGSQLARHAAMATFSSPEQGTSAAVARWWLADRWEALRQEAALVSTGDVEEAQTQALSSPLPTDATAIAMLAEVAGRSIGKLVIVSSTKLGEAREGIRVRTLVENCAWRLLFSVTFGALALAHLRSIVTWLTARIGTAPPEAAILRTAAGVVVTIAVLSNITAVQALYRKLGRDAPVYLSLITGALTALGGFYAYARYP